MRTLTLALTALFFAPLAGLPAAEAPKPAKPNIIVILTDDLGYADLGVHGCKDIPTPNIDKLAVGGVRFTDAYAAGSFCTPTRAALLSGRYQQRLGNEDLTNVTGPLPKAVVTLPQRLRAAGYATGMVGKWHLGEAAGFRPTDRGFDEFFGFLGGGHIYLPADNAKGEYAAPILRNVEPVKETRYLTDAFGEEAVAFLGRQKKDRPFFLYLAFNAVHTPVQATDKYFQRFATIEDRTRRTYAAMLSAVDDAVGAVVAKLTETGQLDRTLILFTSDNGGPTTRNAVNGSRNTPLRGSKCETFEGGIRVPLLAQWPGVLKPGTVYRQPVITMDLTATALAVAGANAEGVEGVNLLPFLSGEKTGAPHEALFWRCRTRSNNYGARQGDWKLVHSTEGGEQPGPKQIPARDMLFNLTEDVGEQNDLAAKHPDKLAALKKLYQEWSDGVDADCRKLGIEPKPAVDAAPKKAPPAPPKPTSHTPRDLEGWTVHIDKRLLGGPDKELGDRALRLLANRLYDIKLVIPADKVVRLQQVPLWLDRTHGKLRPAQYHPSATWLKANGYSETLAKAVHIPDAAEFASVNHQRVQPWSVLHELAHAYHDQVLGFDHAEIRAAWDRFRDSGKYKSVLHINGKQVAHYALTNEKEFFAEMTEAFFGTNDFFPFNRAELQREEPELYTLLGKIWGTRDPR